MAKENNSAAAGDHMVYLDPILKAVRHNWETYGAKAMAYLENAQPKKISIGFPTEIDLSSADPVVCGEISFSQRVREGVKLTLTDPNQKTFDILPAAVPAPKKRKSKKGESTEPADEDDDSEK